MTPHPSTELFRLINGYQITQAIHVAATLGLADHLKGGPRTSWHLLPKRIQRPCIVCYVRSQPLAFFMKMKGGNSRSRRWAIAFAPIRQPLLEGGLRSLDVPTSGRHGGTFCIASKPERTPSVAFMESLSGNIVLSTLMRVRFSIKP